MEMDVPDAHSFGGASPTLSSPELLPPNHGISFCVMR